MANKSLAEFKVRADSRYFKRFNSYNQKTHEYDDEYVNPQSWRILLDARPALRAKNGRQDAVPLLRDIGRGGIKARFN